MFEFSSFLFESGHTLNIVLLHSCMHVASSWAENLIFGRLEPLPEISSLAK